jgi:hypothetical protein
MNQALYAHMNNKRKMKKKKAEVIYQLWTLKLSGIHSLQCFSFVTVFNMLAVLPKVLGHGLITSMSNEKAESLMGLPSFIRYIFVTDK